jgi:hypothetical protein
VRATRGSGPPWSWPWTTIQCLHAHPLPTYSHCISCSRHCADSIVLEIAVVVLTLMTKLRSKETKQQKLAAIIRRTNRCLYNSRCTKVPHSLNRILSVYTKWSTAGYNGASQDFQQLKWTEPQLPQNCISADGIGHVYVIINLKQRLGIYVGWTVKNSLRDSTSMHTRTSQTNHTVKYN